MPNRATISPHHGVHTLEFTEIEEKLSMFVG